MNKFSLNFDDQLLEKQFFWWSYNRDYFILKMLLGGLIIGVQIPSIIISIYRQDYQIAIGWGVLMVLSILSLCSIKYRPQSYNYLLSLYHIMIMLVNVYYLYIHDYQVPERYGKNILFVFAAAHGTSHSTIVMLGTNFLMNSLSMLIAYMVYTFIFIDKGFNTFHLFLLFVSFFTLFGKYMRDRSQRDMFLMRERENKWLNIMKKALPSSIVMVQYNEKLDKINLNLVNQTAKNVFKFQNDESFSEFSRKMQLEKYINFEMTLSNSLTEKFINVDLTNPQNKTQQTLQQYINSRFRDIVRDKKISVSKTTSVIQNLKLIKNKYNNSDIQDKIEQSNSLSNYSKPITQNQNLQNSTANQPSNFFPGDQKEYQKNQQKPSPPIKKSQNNNYEGHSGKIRSQNSSFGTAAARKKKNGQNSQQNNSENIQIETFIGVYRFNEDQTLKRYKVKVIHYNVGQYYCLIVIEEESDEDKIQFLKKINKSSEQVVQHFIDNIGKHIYRITEQLRDQELKALILTKKPQFLKSVKYESSIIYNGIYNIRSHFIWARQKVKPKYDRFPLQPLLDDIYDTFQGHSKAQENRVKLFLSRGSLSNPHLLQAQTLHSDITLIKQLLYSLLQNSFDYTDKGYIVLKLTEIPGENILSTIIKVEVSDSGNGFSSSIEKVNTLLNVQNPQFSDNYYGSICFGLKNGQKIVRALGPYSKLFIFTRNGKGSRICFYLYQNMNVFQQSNNHVQFQNSLFQEDLKNLKELYNVEQKLLLDKDIVEEEESSFLGFENVTEINIREIQEDNELAQKNTKNKSNEQNMENVSFGDLSKRLCQHQLNYIASQDKCKTQIIPKRLFSSFSDNLHDHPEDLGLQMTNYKQKSNISKQSHNTYLSTSNTQIAFKSSRDCDEKYHRHSSLQDEQQMQVKERATSIFKKNNNPNDQSMYNPLSNNNLTSFNSNHQIVSQVSQTPKMKSLDYSIFIDRIQEESSQPTIYQKMSLMSLSEKKNFQQQSPLLKKQLQKHNTQS